MRLIGIEHNLQAWIGVELADGVAPVAEVNAFYADVAGHMGRVHAGIAERVANHVRAVPVPMTAKVLCAGLNYVNHIAESNRPTPGQPDIFARWATTLVPGGTPVPLPYEEPGLDWEGELAAVIGRPLKRATPEEVEDAVLGYTILNDLSARLHQRAAVQWCVGKNADRSAPIGPAIVTREDIRDPYSLRLQTRVDGELMQSESTGNMLFRIGRIGAFASETMTLQPGDVISTGTPAGVGVARKPPVFLQKGQVVEVEIDQIGILSTPIGMPE